MHHFVTVYFNRFKSKIFNIGIYFFASLIPMIASLAINPLIAKNMDPEDYAIVGYYGAFNVLLTSLINFYLLHYYTKRFFELSDQERLVLKATLFKTLIGFSLIIALLAIGGLYIYTIAFNSETQIPFMPYAAMSVLALPLTGIYNLTLVEYKMQSKSKKFFNISVFKGLFAVVLNLLLVVIFKLGAFGKLGATLCASLVVFLYVLVLNRDLFKIKFDGKIFKEAIKFCYPLVLAAMLTFFSNGYDRVVLEKTGNIVELGYYVVAVSIAGYLSVFSTSINDTFQPDIFQSIVQRNIKRCLKFILLKIGLMLIVVMGFIFLAPFIVDILTAGRYVHSTPYAIIIALSVITSMMYYSVSQVTVALGYTSITLINKILGSILSIGMFNFFIAKWGAYGAAWGTVLSFIIFFAGNLLLLLFFHKHAIKNTITK